MCVYLMKMREYFRWEMGLDFETSLPGNAVGKWIQAREQYWADLEEEPYQPITIDDHSYDPFDADGINQALLPKGYVYSAGLGAHVVPHFFLARLASKQEQQGYCIYQATEECARDLTAPPAMTLGKTIFVRRESLRRMLWERLQEWRWDCRDNALGQALGCYPFDTDFEEALQAMTERETRTVLLHEIGEVKAGQELGEPWHELLHQLPRGATELGLRAVRDHWADCQVTLPALLEAADEPALLFYRANLMGRRRQLFPALVEAFEHWRRNGDDGSLHEGVRRGQAYWAATAHQLLEIARTEHDLNERLTTALDQSVL